MSSPSHGGPEGLPEPVVHLVRGAHAGHLDQASARPVVVDEVSGLRVVVLESHVVRLHLVARATASRSTSPVEIRGHPRSTASRRPCVPLPTPGGPSKTTLMFLTSSGGRESDRA